MARSRNRKIITFSMAMIALFVLSQLLECGEARRSIGRSSRTSSRSISRRTYSRSTDYRSRFGSTISTTRSKIGRIGWKKALLAGGLLYIGSRLYLNRRIYHSHPYRQPTICSNYVDSDENGTTFNMFICPRHYEMDSFTRCCGPEGRQTCCSPGSRGGSMIGGIIGAIILVAIIGTIIYCVCRRKKRQEGEVLSKENEQTGTILVPPPQPMAPGPMPPPPMGYGPQPSPMMGYGPDPNQPGGPMNYGATYGQQQPYVPQGYPQPPPPGQGYPQQPPLPGQAYPQQPPPPGQGYPPAYGPPDMTQPPYPTAPVYPGAMPGQAPPPPGFAMPGPMPAQPPPPYPAS